MERRSCCSGCYDGYGVRICEPTMKTEPKPMTVAAMPEKEEVVKPKIETEAAELTASTPAPAGVEVPVKEEEPVKVNVTK